MGKVLVLNASYEPLNITSWRRAVVLLIKGKAEQSEVMVAEICKDIKQLDYAKRHIQETITALKRLHMVVTAVEQLNRYKLMMENYVDHNCSVTISYDVEEVPLIIEWILENWDTYVGVSFIYRNDPTKTAADLGYAYLPQEVVTQEIYSEYASSLLPVDLDAGNSLLELEEADCATGACPIR